MATWKSVCGKFSTKTWFSIAQRSVNPALTTFGVNHGYFRQYSTKHLSGRTVRIGCASGFWGDTAVAVPQLIHQGNIDFLVFDYLSEITMSLLTAARKKYPDLGYAPDFLQVAMAPYIKDIKSKGIRVISNAGGVNPHGCAAALMQIMKKAGVELNVAVVTGDDLMPKKTQLFNAAIHSMDGKSSLPSSVTSMTAYFGAGPIARALDKGADVVITGRCVDSALALAPLLHSYQWDYRDFDKLAAGSLAGHIIECGAQSTGGIFTDWHTVPDWDNIGFPIAECSADGKFVVTKPPNTGGLVTKATVAEQLVYEIGNPKFYILPNVICDFSNVKLEQVGEDEVLVTGAKGCAPTDKYKVSATYVEGYRVTAVCPTGGPRAAEKAQRTADAILKRCRKIFTQLKLADFSGVKIQLLGSEDTYGPHAKIADMSREVVLWMSVHHSDKKALAIFAREIAPAGTGMAPGLTAIVGGRPKVSPVLKLFSFLYPKEKFKPVTHMNGKKLEEFLPPPNPSPFQFSPVDLDAEQEPEEEPSQNLPDGTFTFRLQDLAYTRSGDKGNNCNIGVVARHPSYLPYIKQALSVNNVEEYFAHLFVPNADKKVTRFDLPGIDAINIVLHEALGGGGIASLRSDPQGKALGQMLLDFEIKNVPDLPKLAEQQEQ